VPKYPPSYVRGDVRRRLARRERAGVAARGPVSRSPLSGARLATPCKSGPEQRVDSPAGGVTRWCRRPGTRNRAVRSGTPRPGRGGVSPPAGSGRGLAGRFSPRRCRCHARSARPRRAQQLVVQAAASADVVTGNVGLGDLRRRQGQVMFCPLPLDELVPDDPVDLPRDGVEVARVDRVDRSLPQSEHAPRMMLFRSQTARGEQRPGAQVLGLR
jgi:hypothetical protein